MHDALPLGMDLDGAMRTATIARAEHPVAVAVLPWGPGSNRRSRCR